jgi:hypothetical protein
MKSEQSSSRYQNNSDRLMPENSNIDEATINDILGQMQEASPMGKSQIDGEDNLGNTHISIDINDSMQLEAQGLKRVQIEGFQGPNGQED